LKKPITEKGWWSGSRYRPGVQISGLQKQTSEKQTFLFLFLFGGTGGGTQYLAIAGQGLYHLSHSASPKVNFLENIFI
jgi:hypothetical protein